MHANAAVFTQGLGKAFGANWAVRGLDLVVPRGAFYGFLGPNGAGKTTTISMLTGLYRPTTGTASVLGRDVVTDSRSVKQMIGVMTGDLPLFDRLTGREHLEFVAELYGVPRQQASRRAIELLSAHDLLDRAEDRVANYSTGMRKKLGLCGALIHAPDMLFLDEPFEGVDPVAGEGIRALLLRLNREQQMTIFLTSHVLEIVERLCSHVGIIDDGRLVFETELSALPARGGSRRDALEQAYFSAVGAPLHERAQLDWLRR